MNPQETIPRSRTVETRILRAECHFERPSERRTGPHYAALLSRREKLS